MSKLPVSWINYMGSMQKRSCPIGHGDLDNIEAILKNLNLASHAVFSHSIPWVYLLDYTSGRYLIISKSIKSTIGYDPDYFLDGGLDIVFNSYDPRHLRLFNEEIFPERVKILKGIPFQDHPNYIFSYNFKMKNKQGESLDLLQRNCFVKSDEQGNPLLSFGAISNISHYQRDNPVIQLVEKVCDGGIMAGTSVLSKQTFYVNQENRVLSRKELEVLKWTAEGLTHKEIADRLFIAEGTVLRHRKNMLKKSGTRNVAELVAYAFKNALL